VQEATLTRSHALTTRKKLLLHLDQTQDKHNGLDSKIFRNYMKIPEDVRPSATKLGKLFRVSTPTMSRWMKLYDENPKEIKLMTDLDVEL
jgi:hypothetical protein